LSKIAIILLFVLIHGGYRHYQWLLYVVIGVELLSALLTFSKLEVIEVFVAVGLGFYLGRPNLRVLIVGGIGVILLYVFVLSPFLSFARVAAGAVGVGSAAEVGESVVSYAETPRHDLAGFVPGIQGWWTRLSYSNAQAFVMDAYDHGARGESVGLAVYAFLPRLLFPDKPVMTPGREFTAAVRGDVTETSTGPGVFGEAYWNGGWTMVVAICLYIGAVFAAFAAFAVRAIAAKRYEYLPIIMIGIKMGYRPDDWFVATYVGALANALVLYIVLRYAVIPLVRVHNARGSLAMIVNRRASRAN
jgi:hypothetical protein